MNHILKLKARPGKRLLTFGDFVTGVYNTWGERKGKGIVELAIKARMIEFLGKKRLVVS